jgi:hypothetical protein
MYLVKEQCFRDFVKFSREFDTTANLPDMLATAERLNAEHHVPIIILLGYFGMKEGITVPTIYRGEFQHQRGRGLQGKDSQAGGVQQVDGGREFSGLSLPAPKRTAEL